MVDTSVNAKHLDYLTMISVSCGQEMKNVTDILKTSFSKLETAVTSLSFEDLSNQVSLICVFLTFESGFTGNDEQVLVHDIEKYVSLLIFIIKFELTTNEMVSA